MWVLKGEEMTYVFPKRAYALRHLSMLGAVQVAGTSLDEADEYEKYIAKEFGKNVEYTLTFKLEKLIGNVAEFITMDEFSGYREGAYDE